MEDIHISRYIASELRSFTDFPIYMNAARAFHLRHPKFYYQFADEDFAKSLLELDDTNPSITALQEAISLYNSGDIGIHEALKLSRRQGAMMLNVAFHKQILRDHLQC
jgi:hypothetical protein